MSLRLTPNAQRKNKLVIRTKGTRNRRSVRGADFSLREYPLAAAVILQILDCRLCERAVQVRVSGVNENMLGRDVARLLGN